MGLDLHVGFQYFSLDERIVNFDPVNLLYNVYSFSTYLSDFFPPIICRYDERVRDLLDFSIYLDISNEVKFAWKIQVKKFPIFTCFQCQQVLLINV